MKKLKPGQIRRLVMYYHYLREYHVISDSAAISSGKLASIFDVDDTQVRKDFAAIGVRGQPRVGFNVGKVSVAIRKALYLDDTCNAIIIGAGRLGGAVASYQNLSHFGVQIKDIFDADKSKIGTKIVGLKIRPISSLEKEIKRIHAKVGILSVPAAAAQEMADRCVGAGVKAIWNFAPVQVIVPENIRLVNVYLSASISILCYGIRYRSEEI